MSISRINFVPRQLRLLLISAASVMALSGCGNSNTSLGTPTPPPPPPPPPVACASYTNAADVELTAMAAPTAEAPNCIYEEAFVDNDTPLTASLTLAKLDAGGAHVFSGSLVVGAGSATLADVSTTPVVLTIEAGTTIAFANAADRVIVNRGAQIEAVGTAAAPITFTSMADVAALATADIADDLAATATDQWAGITINGAALNNACTYSGATAGEPSRPFAADAPFTLAATQPDLTAEPTADTPPVETCSEGTAVFTAGTTDADDPTLDYGFHGGTSLADDSGELAFVIIKHVGDATASVNRNALNLRSVGSDTALGNIEVYSVDGSGIAINGGGADLSAVLVYNAQAHGVLATGGYLGLLDGVLVSQADGAGLSCVQVDAGAGGMSATEITDGMNTRVTARNLTCDVSADNANGAGVVVTEGARARIQNVIIVGSRVAADATNANDNACLQLSGTRSFIEADGVIASCLEASTVVTATNFLDIAAGVGAQVIATDADAASPTAEEVAMDIQFHAPGAATTISPLAGTDPGLVVLSDADTLERRALFSSLLSASMVGDSAATVVASSAGATARTYLGAIDADNNLFSGWTFGVFGASPPPPPPPVACASYTNAADVELTAMAAPTAAAPNCLYEASFVDHATPLTASLTLAKLDAGGVHVFSGSLVVGADSATLAGVSTTPVVLTIEAGTTIAFADAANRIIVNRGAQIIADGTAAAPITFTSMADVDALASADTADDLATDAVNEWAGITINGAALNITCTYVTDQPGVLRRFSTTDPFALVGTQPTLTAPPAAPLDDQFALVETCSLGAAVFTAGATDDDAATLADGFHGGTNPDDDSGVLNYVIIKHVGDAAVDETTTPATPLNRNALHLRSVGSGTTLSNIEVYSVDGSGIQIDGGGANLSNVLVYNPQTHGVHATDGYFGLLDTLLVSQADDAGENCVLVESPPRPRSRPPASDGMNTKVTARNLTCDVSAGNEDGAGVIVFNTQARIQNAIIVGSRVAANTAAANDNACLDIVGGSRLPGAPGAPPTTVSLEVDGVITSCLEESEIVTAGNFLSTDSTIPSPPDNRLIATDTNVSPPIGTGPDPRPAALAMDIQFHERVIETRDVGEAPFIPIPTVSPLADPNTRLVLLSDADTLESRTLFSLPLSESSVNDALTTVAASGATGVARTYLGAIAAGTGNNPFSGWTFGVFGTPPPPPEPPPPPPTVACASYTNSAGDDLTAAARTLAAPNCVYEASFVDNDAPLTASLTLANLDAGGVHVFNGSLIVGAGNATLADVPDGTAVVLTIAAGTTVAFADAADRVIVNRGAQIEAVGTAAAPITFTSLADVQALANDDPADDLAADAVNQWGGISINGRSFNNACVYSNPGTGIARRSFVADNPFRLAVNRSLSVGNCSEGRAVLTAGATIGDDPILGDGFHGGRSRTDDSGELAYVIIKHVGDAATGVNRNALNLRSVGEPTTLNNIEVYSVDGTGIVIDGGYDVNSGARDESSLSNILVYNAQTHGVQVTGGFLGLLDTVLVSQAEGVGEACVQVDGGALGMSAAEIADGMNTRVRVWNLTCDVSADNANGAGVVVTEGARARFGNAIIVGSRVAVDDTAANDNACLELVGDRSIIEADGVIASCLEASAVVTAANFLASTAPGDRVIATGADATSPTAVEVAMDIQFHDPESATTISPLLGTDPGLVTLSAVGTLESRTLFSELLSASMVDAAATTVVASGNRTYLGAITPGTNPFSGWTFGVFTPPPSAALLTCASYTGSAGIATAAAAPTAAAPNCVYEAGFVDNATPLTRNITLANLDDGGVHVFSGSLVVGADSPTLVGVPTTAVVLTIEAGATIAFENAADRLIINRGARISAIGTADDPITFTSLADVEALASDDPADDLAATATDQWGGITINGRSLNNACTYAVRDADAATGIVPPRRPLEADNFTPSSIPSLTVEGECSEGRAVLSAGATVGDDPILADGYYGGTSSRESSGRLDFVIIKHVGDAATGVNRNALHLRSVGGGTDLKNIEVYSVDGTGIRIDGGFNTSGAVPYLENILVYNAQEHGIHATGGFLGRFDGVLVSQADGAGVACIQADSGAGGMSADAITDGMNTRVRAQNLTCDVSANNANGAGVVVTEGARARLENAIIVGSEVAADGTAANDNACLELVGDRSIIEADGVIASCLEASAVVTAANFLATASPADRVIATNAATPTAVEVAMDIQFHTPGAATTISPLAGTDPGLVALSAAGTLETRALFSELLSASMVDGAATTVVASGNRTYLGAIAAGIGNNPFSDWTFGVFTLPSLPPSEALLTCASYTNSVGIMTAMVAPTTEAPNCLYEATFVDNDVPLTESITLANLVSGGVHVFSGSLVVGAGSATLADVPTTPVVLTIEAGTTIAFENAADRLIVNRGAQIEAVGTVDNPITFTSLADVEALADDDTENLAATATDQWAGITINGAALNNACTYSVPNVGPRRGFGADPFTPLAGAQPTLTAAECSEGGAVLTAGATAGDDPTLAYGFHGGTSPADDSGSLAFVIIKHVGDATAGTNRNALNLRSVGTATTLSNIEVYSVDGTGIRADGGGANLSNVLVYNPQTHGVHATGGYLGALTTVLVSQADGAGDSCVQVEGGAGGMSAAAITDGMNTRVAAQNLTCDVSADNAGGAGVIGSGRCQGPDSKCHHCWL